MAADVERLARLEREAHLLAALNHPNVATIHGLEEAKADDGTSVRYLVLELVEGGTLADRLGSGALGVEEALDIAPDGQHFVFVRIIEGSWRPSQRILVLNWFEELRRLVPTGR